METPTFRDIKVESAREGYQPIQLETDRGTVSCRHYAIPNARHAAVWVGGIGGDWDTPANGLYTRLSLDLIAEGIASLRVRYRHSKDLEESVFDLLAGLAYLHGLGIESTALTGHSFGGAVVIQAAAVTPSARAVVTLATQGYGTSSVSRLAPACSILLVHGLADRVLSPSNSQFVYGLAHQPKRLVLLDGTGHNLDEATEEVYQLVRTWIVGELAARVDKQ